MNTSALTIPTSRSNARFVARFTKIHPPYVPTCGMSTPTGNNQFAKLVTAPSKLQRHIGAVHSTKERARFPCTFPGCEKTYLNKHHIAQHVHKEHAKHPVRFWCTLCGREFKTRTLLESHIPTHTTEKPYNCATCGRSFSHKGDIKGHEMTHLEKSSRPMLKCDVCPHTFLSRANLQRHIRVVHENRRNYPCSLCDVRFSSSSHLQGHVQAKHVTNKEPTHSCDKCEYKSYSKGNLASHKRRHNAARQGCYFCRKKFIIFQELVVHFRVHTLETLQNLCM
ncbi:zinc finger protein 467-like [Folsomia candida]|uniref:zinc finger protein 467-like n=1 Tax=Folsomia candida TaxID=158441 RepID=UPI001604B9B7|nr:zinc finger protein 467-like [Folsomia candida]